MELKSKLTSSPKPAQVFRQGGNLPDGGHCTHTGEASGPPLLTPGIPGAPRLVLADLSLAAELMEVRKQLQKCAPTRVRRTVFSSFFQEYWSSQKNSP